MSDGGIGGGATDLTGGGGKGAGGAGAGDPFSMMGGSGTSDLGSMFGGGGSYGGGTDGISGLMDFAGDPTGSLAASQSINAGAPMPSTPGGGIGGAQSAMQTPPLSGGTLPNTQPTPVQTTPQTGAASQGNIPGSQANVFQLGSPQAVSGPVGPEPSAGESAQDYQTGLNQLQQGQGIQFPGPQVAAAAGQQPFAQQYGSDLNALGQQALAGGMTGSSTGLPPWLTSQTTQSPLDVTQAPSDFTDQPASAPATSTAVPATAPTTTPTPASTKTPAPPTTPDATDPSGHSTGTQMPTAGAGQQQAFNLPNIIQALMRGGPMGALQELVQEAMGGMNMPALAGQGAGGVPSPQQFQYQQARGRPPPGPTPQQYQQRYSGGAPEPSAPTTPTAPPAATTPRQPSGESAPQQTSAADGTTPPQFSTGDPDLDRAVNAAAAANPAQRQAMAGQGGAASGGTIGAATPALVAPNVVARTQMAGSDTRPTAGYSNYLRQQRAGAARELQNPQTRLQVAGMAMLENGRDPIGPIEALMNRQAMTGRSVNQLLHSGFYGPINRGELAGAMRRLQSNPRLYQFYSQHIDAALSGSNVIGGATDQGLPTDPNGRNPSGRVRRGTEVYNDWGGVRHSAAWRRNQQAQVQDELQQQQPAPSTELAYQ